MENKPPETIYKMAKQQELYVITFGDTYYNGTISNTKKGAIQKFVSGHSNQHWPGWYKLGYRAEPCKIVLLKYNRI